MRSEEARAEDLLAEAARWRDEGRQVALATVVQTWGSSPRPVGSQLIVDDSLRLQGSVSGGCIEGAAVHEAQAVMAGAPPKLLGSEKRRGGKGGGGQCRVRWGQYK